MGRRHARRGIVILFMFCILFHADEELRAFTRSDVNSIPIREAETSSKAVLIWTITPASLLACQQPARVLRRLQFRREATIVVTPLRLDVRLVERIVKHERLQAASILPLHEIEYKDVVDQSRPALYLFHDDQLIKAWNYQKNTVSDEAISTLLERLKKRR